MRSRARVFDGHGVSGLPKQAARNWFERGGADYAQFRPLYPPQLTAFLCGLAPTRRLALDVGCGNGQLTVALAQCFDAVLGLDPSASQLAHARTHERVHYAAARAEQLPLQAGTADLVVAAQAAHWFDLTRFYAEARRVARPGATLALVSYGVLQLPVDLAPCFRHFYAEQIHAHWPAPRRLVEAGYRDLPFPFAELGAPELQIRHWWRADEFVGYVSTWSAVRRLAEAGQATLFSRFAQEISALWGHPERLRPVTWPISLRVGRL